MRLLGHLVAADLRRFGWPIAAWIILVAAGAVAYAWLPVVAGTGRTSEVLRMTGGILWLARQIYRLVLIALIVHAHPTVGSTAFWMTRPISPRVLAGAKALLIGGAFVGAPVAADVALALKYSVPAGDLIASALQTALVNGLWVALSLVVAALTRSLAQFALVCGLAASSLVIVPFAIQLIVYSNRASDTIESALRLSPAAAVLGTSLFAACLVLALFVLYVRRRRPEAIGLSAAGGCLAVALAVVTPPQFLLAGLEPPEWARGAVLQLAADSPTPYAALEMSVDRQPYPVVRAVLSMPALPPGWVATAVLRDATVEGSTRLQTDPRVPFGDATLSGASGQDDNPMRSALRQALGVASLMGAYYGRDAALVFVPPRHDPREVTSLTGRYRGRFGVGLRQIEGVGVLPLLNGATFQEGAYRVAVRDVRLDGPLTVRLQLSGTTPVVRNAGQPIYEFYLRNQSQGEALAGNRRLAREFSVVPGATTLADAASLTPGVWTRAEYLSYRGSPSMSVPGWDLTPEWVGGAELVVVRTTSHGTIDAPLDIERFAVAPARPPGGVYRLRR